MSVINDSYSLSRGYDAGNRPLSHTFADGHSQVWTYDARNLVTNLSYDGEQVLAQSHDAGYRLSTQTLGNGLSRQLTYGRQDNLRTSDVTSDTGVISSLAWNYTYNVDKQVTAENTAGSFLDDSSFTAIMPSILSRHKVSTFFLQKVILKKAEILSPVVDPGDRLVSWTRPGQVAIGSRETENWSYDNAGNHNSVTRDGTTQNRTHNSEKYRGIGGILDRNRVTCPEGVSLRVEEANHNELINVDGDATTRDVKGNMTEDAEGNEYFYDLEHGRRIGGWVDKSRSDGGKARASQVGLASHNRINRIEMDGGDTIELEYDAMGRRVFRKNGSDETAFVWWGDQESSEHVSGAGQPVIQNDLWAHPTALNKIIARAVEGNKSEIEWYHKNYLDHVYAVSDDNGNIDEHYRYTAFGEVEIYSPTGVKLAQSAIGNTVLWNSRRFDQDTNLYYYKYRHYKADYGRWLGRDPIEEDGGYNLYGFVGNEPVGRWDVLGLLTKILIGDKNKRFIVTQASMRISLERTEIFLKELENVSEEEFERAKMNEAVTFNGKTWTLSFSKYKEKIKRELKSRVNFKNEGGLNMINEWAKITEYAYYPTKETYDAIVFSFHGEIEYLYEDGVGRTTTDFGGHEKKPIGWRYTGKLNAAGDKVTPNQFKSRVMEGRWAEDIMHLASCFQDGRHTEKIGLSLAFGKNYYLNGKFCGSRYDPMKYTTDKEEEVGPPDLRGVEPTQ